MKKSILLLFLIMFLTNSYATDKVNEDEQKINTLERTLREFCHNAYYNSSSIYKETKITPENQQKCQEMFKEYVEFLQEKCDKNVASACFAFGLLYVESDPKVWEFKEDLEYALPFFEKSCKLNDKAGCWFAGNTALKLFEKTKNKTYKYKAKKNYKKGCDMGSKLACRNLKNKF